MKLPHPVLWLGFLVIGVACGGTSGTSSITSGNPHPPGQQPLPTTTIVLSGAVSGTYQGSVIVEDGGVPHPFFTLVSGGDASTVSGIHARGAVPGEPPMPGVYGAAVSVTQGPTEWTSAPDAGATLTITGLARRLSDKDGNVWSAMGSLDATLFDASGARSDSVVLHADF